MNTEKLLLYLIVVALSGAMIERLSRFHKHPKMNRFTWVRYVLFIATPLAMSGLIFFALGLRYLTVFFITAFIGTFGEWAVGYYYHHILGKRLWIYRRMSIGGYTSWLIVPLWGFAGIFFAYFGSLIVK